MLPTVGGANNPSKPSEARAGNPTAPMDPSARVPRAGGDGLQIMQSWQKSPVVFCSCWSVINSLQDSGFSFEGLVAFEDMRDFNRVCLNCSGSGTKLVF